MHERYLAPAVAVCVLAGLLDRRLRGVMWAFSVGYAVNLMMILMSYCRSSQGGDSSPAIHASYCVVRFFCCMTILIAFFWLAWQLPKLLKPVDETEAEPVDPARAPESSVYQAS
jgi:uncharacterized membrane protein YdjX (TVP38/TMEM64 family)